LPDEPEPLWGANDPACFALFARWRISVFSTATMAAAPISRRSLNRLHL